MPLPLGEPHDLVFERRTVPRADALNLTVVERALVDVLAHEIAHAIVRVEQPAAHADSRAASGRRERKRHRHVVAALLDEQRRRSTRRRSRCCRRWSRGGVPVFSRPISKPERPIDSASSRDGGSPCRPAGRCSAPTWIRPLRNVPVVTTSARHVETSPSSVARPTMRPPSTRIRPALPKIHVDVRLVAQSLSATHRRIRALVGLRARRPDRRPATSIEQLELNAGRVDRSAHQAAERVDLANEMALRRPADRRDCTACARRSRATACTARRDSPCARPRTRPRRRRGPRRPRSRRMSSSTAVISRCRTARRCGRSTSSLVRAPTTSPSSRARACRSASTNSSARRRAQRRRARVRRCARASFEQRRCDARSKSPPDRAAVLRRSASRTIARASRRGRRRRRRDTRTRALACDHCRRSIALVRDDEPALRDASRRAAARLGGQRLAAIEHDEHQVGDLARARRASDALALDGDRCVSRTPAVSTSVTARPSRSSSPSRDRASCPGRR